MSEPSAGALRAAKKLQEEDLSYILHAKSPGEFDRVMATIIDRETGLPELLEALEEITRSAYAFRARDIARTAIAKAKRET